jgi:hypothetical protein
MKSVTLLLAVVFSLCFIQCKKSELIDGVANKEILDSTSVDLENVDSADSSNIDEDTTEIPDIDSAKMVSGFDRGFERELIRLGIDRLGKVDGKLLYSDVLNVEHLVIKPQLKEDIQGLSGIEHFINLKSFITKFTKPDSLDFSKNNKLEYLQVETGWPVAGERKTLQYLNISNCKMLRYLNCRNNLLSSLNLQENRSLRELHCNGNDNLELLDLSENSELEFLISSDSENLSVLDLSGNRKLRRLASNGKNIRKLDVSMLPELSFLALGADEIELNLGSKTKLDTLFLSYTNVASLDLTEAPNLVSLQLGDGFESIDLTHLKKLKQLSYIGGKLTSLDLSGNPELETLNIVESSISVLNLSANKKLREFFGQNWLKMSVVDLRGVTTLDRFIVSKSPQLATICVSRIPASDDVNWQKPSGASFSLCQ